MFDTLFDRKAALLVAVGLGLIWPAVGFAEENQPFSPPLVEPLDHNNVDVATGEVVVQTPGVSIGGLSLNFQIRSKNTPSLWWDNLNNPDPKARLPYRHSQEATFEADFGTRHEYDTTYNSGTPLSTGEYWCIEGEGNYDDPNHVPPDPLEVPEAYVLHLCIDYEFVFIAYGQYRERFFRELRSSTSLFQPVLDKAASLVESNDTYTYETGDGTVLRFWGADLWDVTKPNGEVITHHYVGSELRSVTSNFGYQLHLQHRATDDFLTVTAINNAIDYCDPGASTCTGLTQSWPTVTYTRTDGTFKATNALGENTEYYFGPFESSLLSGLKTIKNHSGTVLASFSYYPEQTLDGTPTKRVETATLNGVLSDYDYPEWRVTKVTSSGSGVKKYSTSPVGWVVSKKQYNHSSAESGPVRETTYVRTSGVPYWDANLESSEDQDGRRKEYDYDSRGNLTELRTIAVGSGLATIVRKAKYPDDCASTPQYYCNKPEWTEDERGYRTDYTYDPAHGGVLTETHPSRTGLPPYGTGDRAQTRYTYVPKQANYKTGPSTYSYGSSIYVLETVKTCISGDNSCEGTSRERVETYTYESGQGQNLNLVSVETKSGDDLLSKTVTTKWDDYGRQFSIDGPLPGDDDKSITLYDILGRVVVSAGAKNSEERYSAVRTSYDGVGNPYMVENGYLTSSLTEPTDPVNFVTEDYAYNTHDTYGRLIKTEQRDPSGTTNLSVVENWYNSFGQLGCTAFRMDPANTTVTGACDSQPGTEGGDRITYFDYDLFDQVTETKVGSSSASAIIERETDYNIDGSIKHLYDGEGNKTYYTYDPFGRPDMVYYPDKILTGSYSTTDYTDNTYDAFGRLENFRNRAGDITTYTYDNLGGIDTKTLGAGKTIKYGYNHDGVTTLTQFTDGSFTIISAPDVFGRTTSVTDSGSMVFGIRTVSYGYDQADRRTSLTYDDGKTFTYDYYPDGQMEFVKDFNGIELAKLEYDDKSRRKELKYTASNGIKATYGYADDDALTSLTYNLYGSSNDVTLGYSHNAQNQITGIDVSNNAYVWSPGSSTSDAYDDNGLNQHTSVAGTTLTHDPKGNLTNDGVWTYAYDIENQLISASKSGMSVTYEYDPLKRRSAKVVNGVRTEYHYDGARTLSEHNSSGSMLRKYVYGVGVDERLFWYEGNTRYGLHGDHQGSTIAVSNSSGNLVNQYSYSPYGNGAPTTGVPFKYTGRYLDAETGLYYYRARMYSPILGRFLQPDPIGYGDGMNMYAYVGNDPLNQVDPSGQIAGKAIKYLRDLKKNDGNPVSAGVDTIKGAIEDLSTLADGQWNVEDIQAAISLISGLDKKDQASIKGVINRLRKGSKTRRTNAADHRDRADQFEQNPTVRPGMENRPPEDIARQQQERLDHLRGEADEFEAQADAADAIAEELEKLLED